MDSALGAAAETTSPTNRAITQEGSVTTVPQYQQPTAVVASAAAEKAVDVSTEAEVLSTTKEYTVKPTTGSYEEIRNMEEIDQSLTLLEPMQEMSSTLPTVSISVELEGSGDSAEEHVQRKSCARQKYR